MLFYRGYMNGKRTLRFVGEGMDNNVCFGFSVQKVVIEHLEVQNMDHCHFFAKLATM